MRFLTDYIAGDKCTAAMGLGMGWRGYGDYSKRGDGGIKWAADSGDGEDGGGGMGCKSV